jgi:DNA adenine methylase
MLKPFRKIDPVIKWSGSKSKIALTVSKYVPPASRYFEPFVGGGAMLPFRKTQSGFAGDVIPELIALWNMIKTQPDVLADEYESRWKQLQQSWEHYYVVREQFNKHKDPSDFLFLTRTCVNGLIRYNHKGEFNNSLHLSRPGINPKTLRHIILSWSHFIQDVHFEVSDYRTTLRNAGKGDFVFLDPPYGGTRGRYTKDVFDLATFYSTLGELNDRGVKWILTFDGIAGTREYKYDLPEELYQHRIYLGTGNSPFTKMMRTTIDAVYESVYLNFQPTDELSCDLRKNVFEEPTLFSRL